jgi:rhamnosyltransferase
MKFEVSVIIPTYNGEKELRKLLPTIRGQEGVDIELILIDSNSKDGTKTLASNYVDVYQEVEQAEFDHGGTRHFATKLATKEILVFLTQDALLANENSIYNLVNSFSDPKVAAAYGRQLSYEKTNLFGKHLREFNYPENSALRSLSSAQTQGLKTAQLSNSFSAYRKGLYDKIGGFPSNLILGEDVYVGGKLVLAGYSIAYVSDAVVYHSHSYSVLEEFKRYFDIGVFHNMESWLLNEFGKAEGEGLKYLKSELLYIYNNSSPHLMPAFFIRNAAKYLGYKLGYNYELLPKKFVKKMSMHWRWWNKQC